jgi:antitoxin MazE
MQTNIIKWGNSHGIRIPKPLLQSMDLSPNDTIEIISENDRLIIKKVDKKKKYLTIQERFEGFDGESEVNEIDWGKPVGEEIW